MSVLNIKFHILFLPLSRVIAIFVTKAEILKRAGPGSKLGSRIEHFGDVESFCFTVKMIILQRVVMKVKWDHLCKMTGTQQIFGRCFVNE